MPPTSPPRPITRQDLESAFAGAIGEVQSEAKALMPQVVVVVAAVAVTALAVAYILGRRGGRRRSAVVEIRRL
jgi:hypothetical protein